MAHRYLPALLGALLCMAATAHDPVSIVRALRAESNAAIAAHDAARLRSLFEKDYLGRTRHGRKGYRGKL